MPRAGRPALRRSSPFARAYGAILALSPRRSRAAFPCGTITGASTCPMPSSRSLPFWASRVRLPSCEPPRGTAAPSASSARSRRTCSGCAPSTPSKSFDRRYWPFGRSTTRPGSSNGMGFEPPPPSGRASFHPWHWPRRIQSGVSQIEGGTGSSTERRSMLSLAGSLLAEISLAKLAVAWILLIGLPGLVLGASPLIVSVWIARVSSKLEALLSGVWPALLLVGLAAVAWFGGRPLFRLAETSFWSLNALVVQPGYAVCRETLRHVVEGMLLTGASKATIASVRAALAAASGLLIGAIGLLIVWLAWPATQWAADLADLPAPHRLALPAVANAVVIVTCYFGLAGLAWGVADAKMPQPWDLRS